MVEQFSHAVQWDSLKMMSTEHKGSAVTAWLLRSPCHNAHKNHIFLYFRILTELLSFRHIKCLVMVCLSSEQEMQRETSGLSQCKSVGFPSHLTLKIKESYLEAKENARWLAPHSNIPCRSLSTRCTQPSSGYTKSWTCHQLVMQRVSSESPFSC